ncbi:MAG: hypothetical protein JXQ73_06170 [Phycisphaerae bacterium]|nr:hypothetical protein [Phycisphaerae bacterium]
MSRKVFVAGASVLAVVCAMTTTVTADYWDNFDDMVYKRTDPNGIGYDANDPYYTDPNYWTDPNVWDADNPDWTIHNLIGTSYGWGVGSDAVANKALRLAVVGYTIGPAPMGYIGTSVQTGDTDPNTSPCFWDDTTDHYLLTWCYYTNFPADPNNDKGRFFPLLHADTTYWWGISSALELDAQAGALDEYPHTWHAETQGIDFTKSTVAPYKTPFWNFERVWTDPNAGDPGSQFADPNDPTLYKPNDKAQPKWYRVSMNTWERTGLWILTQFTHDPNYASGDPNGKYLKQAIWHGGKFDWDGEYLLDRHFGQSWASGSKPGYDTGLQWYRSDGINIISIFSDINYQNGYPAEGAFDNIEARTGVFTNVGRALSLSIVNSNYGSVSVDPDLLDDPNHDANDISELRRYTDGTGIILVAEPIEGKSFNRWTIFDPNYPGDANFATFDSNTVLYVTMDDDKAIEAAFKCGSGMPPFVAMSLLALGLGVVIRRLT